MTSSTPDQRPAEQRAEQPAEQPERTAEDVMWGRLRRRRDRIRAEIHRNRTTAHKIPTWVLATILGLILLGWLYLVVIS